MIVIARTAVKRLVEKGEVDVWTPRGTNAPRGNIIHVVRTSSSGDTFTHAKLASHHEGVLQDVTAVEAASAGFKRRDDFYAYWQKRYATSHRSARQVLCWVRTYERVDLDIPQFMAAGGGYTSEAFLSVDKDQREGFRDTPLSAVTEPHLLRRWAAEAESQRLASPGAQVFPWEKRKRYGGEARKFRRDAA